MEIVFYNKNGRPIAYTEDWATIYLYTGDPVAYLDQDAVYAFAGTHLGWFVEGRILDRAGRDVFFTDLAMGQPAIPVGLTPVRKDVRRAMPIRQKREAKPALPERAYAWARRSSEKFFFPIAVPAVHRTPCTPSAPFRVLGAHSTSMRETGVLAA